MRNSRQKSYYPRKGFQTYKKTSGRKVQNNLIIFLESRLEIGI
ncbi:hypothetical protein Vi05172_g8974 [Venturia inaequalis]|nr:hypothetical protein Vi05172_g8974 [Venturia inaequalis]